MWTEDTDSGLCSTCNLEDSNLTYQKKIAIIQLPQVILKKLLETYVLLDFVSSFQSIPLDWKSYKQSNSFGC